LIFLPPKGRKKDQRGERGAALVAASSASAGTSPNGVELKAERRKPSGEKHCDIENLPSLTGVLAHFRFH
jgi:hypothetical protein